MADNYNEFYSTGDFAHFKQDRSYVKFLCSHLPDPHNATLLDVGCGRGYWSRLFRECGIGRVVGIDISRTGLQIAQQESPDIEFQLADARQLTFPDRSFDMIFCQGLSEFNVADLERARPAAIELLRCLKDTGILVLAYTTNFSGEIRRGWRQHKGSVIPDFLESLDCRVEATYHVERAVLLRLLGEYAIRNRLLKLALPLVCRLTGFAVSQVCLARRQSAPEGP